MTEYFTIEFIAALILPVVATMGLVHSRRAIVRQSAVKQMVRDMRRSVRHQGGPF